MNHINQSLLLLCSLVFAELGCAQTVNHPRDAHRVSAQSGDRDDDDRLEAGFRLMKEERLGELGINQAARDVLTLVGQPGRQSARQFAPHDGTYSQAWEYPALGITLTMTSGTSTGPQVVGLIHATEPCRLHTRRGIRIGSPSSSVRAAYARYEDAPNTSETRFVAGTDYGGVIFVFRSDRVHEMWIGAVAE